MQHGLNLGARPMLVAVSEEGVASPLVRDVLAALDPNVPQLHTTDAVFETISDTVTNQGIVAAFPLNSSSALLPRLEPDAALVLVLDRVADPGNVGALLRSGAAAGCDAILLAPGCADPYNPKTVRSSGGGVFGAPVASLSWAEIEAYIADLPQRYAARGQALQTCYEADLAGGCAILVGNEAEGLGPAALALATQEVGIPITTAVESLNVAAAGAVLLFEARRQRAVRDSNVHNNTRPTNRRPPTAGSERA